MEENGICSACFLRKRGAAGSNPLSLAALASSPKGEPLRYTGNFTATAKSRPLGEGGCERSEQTEGVLPGQAALHLIRELSRHAKGSPFGRAVKAARL